MVQEIVILGFLIAHFEVCVTEVVLNRVKALKVIFISVFGVIQFVDAFLSVVAVNHGLSEILLRLRTRIPVRFGRTIIIRRNMVWIYSNWKTCWSDSIFT